MDSNERFGKLAHQSFKGRMEWPKNTTTNQGIVVVGVSPKLGGPLDSPIREALTLSLAF